MRLWLGHPSYFTPTVVNHMCRKALTVRAPWLQERGNVDVIEDILDYCGVIFYLVTIVWSGPTYSTGVTVRSTHTFNTRLLHAFYNLQAIVVETILHLVKYH